MKKSPTGPEHLKVSIRGKPDHSVDPLEIDARNDTPSFTTIETGLLLLEEEEKKRAVYQADETF